MTSTTGRCLLLVLVGLASCGAPRTQACGPDFPNAYLTNSLDELTTLPALSLQRELEQLLPAARPPTESSEARAARHAAAERTEVRDALLRSGMTRAECGAALEAYRRDGPPSRLPREFQLYAQGARAWHDQRTDDAVAAWTELLGLPPSERVHRSVWAAYMITRARCDSDAPVAIDHANLVRRLVNDGFADSQELAKDILGWEARAHWRQGNYAEALKLYLEQFAAGEPTALGSIQLTLRRAFSGEDPDEATIAHDGCDDQVPAPPSALQAMAADPRLRAVVTAWFGARGGPSLSWTGENAEYFRRWIACLPAAGDLSPEEADRWCWAAYQNGLWTEAQALADEAPTQAPAAEWVRAMLLLRRGFVQEAAKHLATATRAFATDPALAEIPEAASQADCGALEHQPLGDCPRTQLDGARAVLAVRRERYAEALGVFMHAHLWTDAAYVAERVLTLDELRQFVDAELPDRAYERPAGERDGPMQLRHLLARRLTRAKRFDDARAYYPVDVQTHFDAYVAKVRRGWNDHISARERAMALWAAAQLLEEHGMAFEGTELEPDYAIWDGSYRWPEFSKTRVSRHVSDDGVVAPRWAIQRDTIDLSPTIDELNRRDAAVVPTRRFHYRYRAAELGWLAASLLPNDDPATADMLNTAGRWVASRDADFAAPYYRMLVLRCPNTEVGRAAAAGHWFVNRETHPDVEAN
jgi:tetratricopeptide (TPR) repeat protein